jgi:hypothetical protein
LRDPVDVPRDERPRAATQDDIVIRNNAGVTSIDIEFAGKIVSHDGIGAQRALVRGAANVNGGDATGRRKEAVLDHGIVSDQAVMDALKGNSVTSAGDHNVVRHRHISPVLVKGVDPLQIGRKRGLWVRLPNDQVAVNQDVREGVEGNAWRERAILPLHRVFVIAVADIEVVVDGVMGDREVVRGIVNGVIAEVVDDIVSEEHAVCGQERAKAHVLDVRSGHRDAARVGLTVRAVASQPGRDKAPARLPNPLRLAPAVLSAELICMFSRMMSVVGYAAP